jgi:hypothetical protein
MDDDGALGFRIVIILSLVRRKTEESNPVGLAPLAVFEAAAVAMRPSSMRVLRVARVGLEPTIS